MSDRRLWISALWAVLLAFGAGGCASTPGYAGLTSDEIFERATGYLEAEEWDNAIQGFETLLFGNPTFERAPEARLHLAEAFFGKEQYLSAASEYERVITRYPSHELAPEAALGVCRSHVQLSPIVQRDQQYTRQALRSCASVAEEFPGSEAARRATELRDDMLSKLAEKDYQRGAYYFDREFYDSALVFLQDVLERYPNTPAAPKALLRMYEAYRAIGYSEDAEEARQRLLEEYPESAAARELEQGRADDDAPASADDGDGG